MSKYTIRKVDSFTDEMDELEASVERDAGLTLAHLSVGKYVFTARHTGEEYVMTELEAIAFLLGAEAAAQQKGVLMR